MNASKARLLRMIAMLTTASITSAALPAFADAPARHARPAAKAKAKKAAKAKPRRAARKLALRKRVGRLSPKVQTTSTTSTPKPAQTLKGSPLFEDKKGMEGINPTYVDSPK